MNAMTSKHAQALRRMLLAALLAPGLASALPAGHGGMQMPMPMPPTAEQPVPQRPDAPHSHAHKKKTNQAPPACSASVPERGAPAAGPPAMPIDMPMGDEAADHAAPTQPRTPIPVPTAADRAAAVPPPSDHPVHDDSVHSYVVFDRLEAWDAAPGTGFEWEGKGWIGTDRNRLWLRSEGEQRDGRSEASDLYVKRTNAPKDVADKAVASLNHILAPGGRGSGDDLIAAVAGNWQFVTEIRRGPRQQQREDGRGRRRQISPSSIGRISWSATSGFGTKSPEVYGATAALSRGTT
jgi:hypothetical protein